MKEVTLLVLTSQNDDSEASQKKEIMLFPSIEAAKKFAIEKLCNDFWLSQNCDTYAKVVNELCESGIDCGIVGDGINDKIWWEDDGKGEEYSILTIKEDGEFYVI